MYVCMYVCKSSLQRWWIRLLVGFTDPYNHTYSESLWWKLFKNHQKTQIQRQRQWQRQRQRQRHRKSAWNTQLMLYFWNPDDSLIPNMMIDTSPWSSCSRRSPWSPWLPCSSPTFSSTGPSVSPFRDFWISIGSERWKEKILEKLRSQLVKKSQGARSIQKVKQKRFFLKRNEGISSIVYLLYLKQIYLHIFMQHSFITIYSLDSISCGRGGSMFFDHWKGK